MIAAIVRASARQHRSWPCRPAWIVAVFLLGTATACQKSETAAAGGAAPGGGSVPARAQTPAAAKAVAAAPAAGVPDPVRKLLGRWQRADGGYTLELRNAELSGVMEAGYFNPKPIRVSRAAWMQGAAGFQVMVELNDVGYPGATYVLTYQPQTDRLVGQYTQPAMQQSFDIEFTREQK